MLAVSWIRHKEELKRVKNNHLAGFRNTNSACSPTNFTGILGFVFGGSPNMAGESHCATICVETEKANGWPFAFRV
jgi:hypothetical protein